jgi:hypothetical protein
MAGDPNDFFAQFAAEDPFKNPKAQKDLMKGGHEDPFLDSLDMAPGNGEVPDSLEGGPTTAADAAYLATLGEEQQSPAYKARRQEQTDQIRRSFGLPDPGTEPG